MMMYDISCEVISDVLPLYAEDLVSRATKDLVQAHLTECGACRQELEQITRKMVRPADNRTGSLARIQGEIQRKKVRFGLLLSLFALLLGAVVLIHLNSPIILEDHEKAVTATVEEPNKVRLSFSEQVAGYELSAGRFDSSGIRQVYHLTAWTTRWHELFEQKNRQGRFSEELEDVVRIYYYSPGGYEQGKDALIYSNTQLYYPTEGGSLTMPRLVLKGYERMALFISVLGAVLWLILRSKGRAKSLWKALLFPVSYVISSFLILYGKNDGYNTAYYFSAILITTILMYAVAYYLISRRIGRPGRRI